MNFPVEEIFDIPALAVAAFERTTGLNVAFHDLSGQLVGYLSPERFAHNTPPCLAVKTRYQDECSACDINFTRTSLKDTPAGRVQICHAGMVEWVIPAFLNDRLEWVMFCGQRTPGPRLTKFLKTPGGPMSPSPLNAAKLPAPVDDEESSLMLELARQLGSRLREWQREMQQTIAPAAQRGSKAVETATRRVAIKRFIHSKHAFPVRLSDLAEYLHISESRAGHAVREACGQSFIELLTEARLKTAASLLRHSSLSVLEVATRSGFGDISNFHHAFRRRFRITPHQYRCRDDVHAP